MSYHLIIFFIIIFIWSYISIPFKYDMSYSHSFISFICHILMWSYIHICHISYSQMIYIYAFICHILIWSISFISFIYHVLIWPTSISFVHKIPYACIYIICRFAFIEFEQRTDAVDAQRNLNGQKVLGGVLKIHVRTSHLSHICIPLGI